MVAYRICQSRSAISAFGDTVGSQLIMSRWLWEQRRISGIYTGRLARNHERAGRVFLNVIGNQIGPLHEINYPTCWRLHNVDHTMLIHRRGAGTAINRASCSTKTASNSDSGTGIHHKRDHKGRESREGKIRD
jgi:hypothetical protein